LLINVPTIYRDQCRAGAWCSSSVSPRRRAGWGIRNVSRRKAEVLMIDGALPREKNPQTPKPPERGLSSGHSNILKSTEFSACFLPSCLAAMPLDPSIDVPLEFVHLL
jgi:hypothetical protein